MILALSNFWEAFILLLIFIPLIMLWIFTLADVFVRRDLSGLARALWAVFVLVVPLLGVLVYFIARPMEVDEEVYDPGPAAGEVQSTAAEIERLDELRRSGALTDEEFQAAKARLLR